MALPYIGEIRIFAGSFAPQGWWFCDGSLLPIQEYGPLFSLIGNAYGGDGKETFAVPDLRGRVPICEGNGYNLAQMGGAESVTLDDTQLAGHNHALMGTTSAADAGQAEGNVLAQTSSTIDAYQTSDPGTDGVMANGVIGNNGNNDAHENRQPFVSMYYIISVTDGFISPPPSKSS